MTFECLCGDKSGKGCIKKEGGCLTGIQTTVCRVDANCASDEICSLVYMELYDRTILIIALKDKTAVLQRFSTFKFTVL